MKLFSLVGSVLIAKALAIPYMINCHDGNHSIYKNDATIGELSKALADISNRKPIFIDKAKDECGVKVTFNKTSGYINIHHGAIAKDDCTTTDVFCDNFDDQPCQASIKCCKNIDGFIGFTCNAKYYLKALDHNSEEYKKHLNTNCRVSKDKKINCYQIKQLSFIANKDYINSIEANLADSNNNINMTTTKATTKSSATQSPLTNFYRHILLILLLTL